MTKMIMLLLVLMLTGCAGSDEFRGDTWNLTSSTCNSPQTTLEVLGRNTFSDRYSASFTISQTANSGQCQITAKGGVFTEANTTTSYIISTDMVGNCVGVTLQWETAYTSKLEDNVLSLSNNACVNTYQKQWL